MSKAVTWVAWSVAGVVAIVHLLTAGRYDAFVNELYFIVCGRHPALGYVDQPPLVPLLAALSQIFGTNVWLLRLPAVLAAVLLVPLVVAFAQLLGSGTRGAWLAALAAATSPMLNAMTATLTTSTLEPLAWTALAYCVTRAMVRDESRMWLAAGAVAGVAFEARYGVILWLIALAIGVGSTSQRSAFGARGLWVGAAIGAVVALPNALWQIVHGLPFLELVRNDSAGNLTGTPLMFTIDQVLSLNFLFAPLWVTGIVAPFASARFAPFRFLSITFVACAALVFLTHGKSYYLAGAYPTMFALGAAACTALPVAVVAIWATLATANGVLALPFVLPIYTPARLKYVVDHSSFKMRPVEVASIGAPLTQVFSFEFGWRDLADAVGQVYASLPPSDRAKAAIYASNYGEAGAIDVFGSGLPPVISGNNQYYLWGPRAYDGSVVVAVNVDRAKWSQLCDSLQVAAHFGTSPYVMPREADRPIFICRGMHQPLAQVWPQLKYYGI
jgi:4-amino-4-deoxy-L-arabinose transferase-like glycosyltransferase